MSAFDYLNTHELELCPENVPTEWREPWFGAERSAHGFIDVCDRRMPNEGPYDAASATEVRLRIRLNHVEHKMDWYRR